MVGTSALSDEKQCRWCGCYHSHATCPRVRAIEYHDDGFTVRRVEFWGENEKFRGYLNEFNQTRIVALEERDSETLHR